MARYKVSWTVFKDPKGRTLKGPTLMHGVGDLCSGLGLIGILMVILAFMEDYGTGTIIGGVITAAAGFALGVLLHKKAKAGAEAAFLKVLAEQEGQAGKD